MGPPSRPVDKPTSTVELTDVLAQAGVDVTGEENLLTADFSSARNAENASFTSTKTSSFTSATSGGSDMFTTSGQDSSQERSQASQRSQVVPYQHTPLSAPAVPHQTTEQLAQEEWQAALRRHAQARAQHLDAPFLSANSVRLRISRMAYRHNIRVPHEGFQETRPHPPAQRIQSATMTGEDGTSIVAVTARHLDRNAPLSEMLALLSLAANERVRGLIEDAMVLAKGRRAGAQGTVPVDWADVAVSNGAEPGVAKAVTAGRAGWESVGSPQTSNSLKRASIPPQHAHASDETDVRPGPFPVAGPEPVVADATKASATTVSFSNELAKSLRGLSAAEREAEEGRLAKRARVKASSANTPAAPSTADGSKASSVAPSTPTATAPGTPGERAPDVAEAMNSTGTKKLTKKEQAKQQSARLDVAHQQQSANNTARMMLGGASKKFGKKYAWMTGGAPGGGGSGASTPGGLPGRLNISLDSPGGSPGGASGPGSGGALPRHAPGKRLGEWREDKERGSGIQLRDWVHVLEADGKERKALAAAYATLK
ncbi:MAG: hypothetical protein M1838_000857 [Thelocarpon superellum]|nr:MAG: hypothetical protein M1838_000857 [Thelocarpon superellum]